MAESDKWIEAPPVLGEQQHSTFSGVPNLTIVTLAEVVGARTTYIRDGWVQSPDGLNIRQQSGPLPTTLIPRSLMPYHTWTSCNKSRQ